MRQTKTFEIHYNTNSNDYMLFEYRADKNGPISSIRMKDLEGGKKTAELDVADKFEYRYVVVMQDGRIEERHWRTSPKTVSTLTTHDSWCSPESVADAFGAEAFAKAIFRREPSEETTEMTENGSVKIILREPRIGADEEVCIVSKQIVNWNADEALRLKPVFGYNWVLDLGVAPLMKEFEFKFGIWDTKNNCFKRYEDGDNRVIHTTPGETEVFTFNEFNFGRPWRAAGVAVPVFSLRTHRSRGCGEFLDLKELADWCEAGGLKVIQLLPINDTTAIRTWRDSYPYNAISIMALHPSYIAVEDVYAYYGMRLNSMERETGLYLNDTTFLEYNRVRDWKDSNLRSLFNSAFKKIIESEEIKKYIADNQSWLPDYAAFATLRNKYSTPNFNEWPEMNKHTRVAVSAMFRPDHPEYENVMYRVFIQFHLERQLREAIDYVHSKGIAIKGDLPIGINPYSADAWTEPEVFNFGQQAGAPPDFFSRDGQNWGFPIYNWDIMKKDGYAWWERRMQRMQQFFDAFRIDHILGFFRIWGIPRPFKSGIMGIFNPATPLRDDEIHAWGFNKDIADFAHPVVSEDYLSRRLTDYSYLARKMFEPHGYGMLRLKEEFFSPEAIEAWVLANVEQVARDRVRTALLDIIHEVLFVSVAPGEWHPRIMLTETERFRMLNDQEKGAIKAISDDFFFNRHNILWKDSAEEHLGAMLSKCNMLVCGEDLGMIPATVPIVMQRMQILSLELQRMPKLYWERFGNTANYPYLSVCATSSHDISSIRGWWEEDRSGAEYFYHNVMQRNGDVPNAAAEDIVTTVVDMHLHAPSMLCINPIQDWVGMVDAAPHLLPFEERINEPSNPNQMWRYRVPFCIEDLTKHNPKVHEKVRSHVEQSGRLF